MYSDTLVQIQLSVIDITIHAQWECVNTEVCCYTLEWRYVRLLTPQRVIAFDWPTPSTYTMLSFQNVHCCTRLKHQFVRFLHGWGDARHCYCMPRIHCYSRFECWGMLLNIGQGCSFNDRTVTLYLWTHWHQKVASEKDQGTIGCSFFLNCNLVYNAWAPSFSSQVQWSLLLFLWYNWTPMQS